MSHCQHRSVGAYVSLILRKSTKLNEVLDNWASTKVPFFSFHQASSQNKTCGLLRNRRFLLPRNARMKGLNHLGYSDTQTLSLGWWYNMWQPVTVDPFPLELGAGIDEEMMKKTTCFPPSGISNKSPVASYVEEECFLCNMVTCIFKVTSSLCWNFSVQEAESVYG